MPIVSVSLGDAYAFPRTGKTRPPDIIVPSIETPQRKGRKDLSSSGVTLESQFLALHMPLGITESVAVSLIGGVAGGTFSTSYKVRVDRIRRRREILEPIYDELHVITERRLKNGSRCRWRSMNPSDRLLVSPPITRQA